MLTVRWMIRTYLVIAWNLIGYSLSHYHPMEYWNQDMSQRGRLCQTVTYAFKRYNLAKLGPGFTSTSPLRDTRRLKKKTNGINKMVEENKIKTWNCLLFFDTLFLRKNNTLNGDKNKKNLLTKIKEHAI